MQAPVGDDLEVDLFASIDSHDDGNERTSAVRRRVSEYVSLELRGSEGRDLVYLFG